MSKFTIQNTIGLPKLTVKGRQLFDLEMLMVGGFNPLNGFNSKEEYESILSDMRLPSGHIWTIPIVLDVNETFLIEPNENLLLVDEYGNPLAVMEVSSRWKADKEREAQWVYKTLDKNHPGVKYLFDEIKNEYIGGRIHKIQLPPRHDFEHLRFTPDQLKNQFKRKNWKRVIAFQTRNPMHKVHFELIRRAHKKSGAPVLVHPVVGMTKDGDIDYVTRVHTYETVCKTYGKDFTMLALLPLAMRMAGPREALWHMLIRKNYGVTHLIIGRDHAGPGKDEKGEDYYKPYEARDLAIAYSKEIGVEVLPSDELVYSEDRKSYICLDDLKSGEKIMSISGTEFRSRLDSGQEIPSWFSFPEIVDLLTKSYRTRKKKGLAILLTGLSGAGKSTIANHLVGQITEVYNKPVTLLDGDIIREYLSSELGFTEKDRIKNVERISFVASEIVKHGGTVVCALIAPYSESRQKMRNIISQNGNFVEVYVSTPLKVCEERDVKGLYLKARKGIIKNFTGISDPYEAPTTSEIVVSSEEGRPQENAKTILQFLINQNLL